MNRKMRRASAKRSKQHGQKNPYPAANNLASQRDSEAAKRARLVADLKPIEDDARAFAAHILSEGHTRENVHELVSSLASETEAIVSDVQQRMPPENLPACQEGCAWCCSIKVETTAPEVLRIVEYLYSSRPSEEIEELRASLALLTPKLQAMSWEARYDAQVPCPLLVDNACSVYEVRPMTCRGWNSRDARACEESSMAPGKGLTVPVEGLQHMTFLSVWHERGR